MRKSLHPSPFGTYLEIRKGFALTALVVLLAMLSAPQLSAQRIAASSLLDGTDADQVLTLADMQVEAGQLQKHAYQGNMDLVRTENDIQPYSIISQDRIARSGATTVEDLLRQQLTMSTAFGASDNVPGEFKGSGSSFSLRGMGAAQTLVLVNGRRVAGVGNRGNAEGSDQPDLNGIPLSAIERIEVLPASASAIYGSGALGGVINVVLRGNYSGNEFNARYETADDGHASIETYNLTSGFQFEGGRSQLLVSVQSQVARPLYGYQRDFQLRGRSRQLLNNPDAIYVPAGQVGNPPAGALVNIRSANGSPLFGPGSSHFTHIPVNYRGWQLDGLQPLIDNQGSYNLDLAGRGLLNGFSGDIALIGASRSNSLNLSSSRDMTERFRLFFDGGVTKSFQREANNTHFTGGWATVEASAPNNPFGQDVRVMYPVRHIDRETAPEALAYIRQQRVALGFELSLPRDWKLVGDYAWSYSYINRINRQYDVHPLSKLSKGGAIAAGLVDVLRDTTSFETLIDPYSRINHANTKAWQGDSTLRAAGPLTKWYAGDITLASGVEHRELRSAGRFDTDPTLELPLNYRRQQIDSLYAEATVPLASPDLGLRGLYSVDVQMALRHERFDVETAGNKFDTTVPTLGLRWLPVRDLMLRGSWGKGFRAPNYSQLADPTLSTATSQINDPRRGGEVSDIYTLSGGNPDLVPETSRNFNIGIVWTPEFARGLRLSADFYKIEKKNNLTSLGAQTILDQEAIFPGRVIRDTPAAGDPYGVGQVLQVHTYAMNLLKMETAGVDLGARYLWQTAGAGDFDLGVNATLTDYYREQSVFSSPLVDWVGVPSRGASSPLDSRVTASLLWQCSQWNIGWSAQYYDHYRLNPTSTTAILSQGSARVPSQTYHDLFIRYRIGAQNRILAGLELTLGAKNLFDKAPPVDMSTNYHYSTLGDPRLRRIYVNVKKTF